MEESSSYTFSSITKAMPELSVLSSYTLPSITRPIITASTPSPTTDSKLTVIHSPLSSVYCDHCISMVHYYCILLGSVDPAAMVGVGFGVVVLLVLAGSSCLLCVIWQMRRRKRRLELIQEVIMAHTHTLFYTLSYSLSLPPFLSLRICSGILFSFKWVPEQQLI